MERKKLELELNKPTILKLLFDSPIVGESQYGKYYLYAVRNGDESMEYSYFADKTTHEQLKGLKKGAEVEITKLAVQRGKKLVTSIDVKILSEQSVAHEQPKESSAKSDSYFDAMVKSFEDALLIQKQFNSMVKIDQIAISTKIMLDKGFIKLIIFRDLTSFYIPHS